MKFKPLLNVFLLLILRLSDSSATNNAMLLGKEKDLNVALSNVCEYYGQVTICNGNNSAGIHPSIGILKCSWPQQYMHYDSLEMDTVQFLQIPDYGSTPWDTKIMFLGNHSTIMSYDLTYANYYCDTIFITPQDTLHTDSVSDMISNLYDGLAVIRKTSSTPNFIYYDTSFSVTFSLQLNMIPLFVSIPAYPDLAGVVGLNQNNETVLNIIDISLQQVVLDTVLGPDAANPFSLNFYSQQQLLLATSPGDSITNVIKYNYQSGVWTHATVYAGSGINVATWQEWNLHFQPLNDTTVNALHRKVMVYNCNLMSMTGTYDINKRLSVLTNPVNGYGYYYYLHAVSDSLPSTAYRYDWFNYTLADSFETALNPTLFRGDYRCPVKVDEYDDSRVEWTVYPNPSMTDFKLSASGLICGREYKMDIIDENGKVLYESTVHAKMTVSLPTAHFDPGFYFVRIHTLKGFITQQIIKQ